MNYDEKEIAEMFECMQDVLVDNGNVHGIVSALRTFEYNAHEYEKGDIWYKVLLTCVTYGRHIDDGTGEGKELRFIPMDTKKFMPRYSLLERSMTRGGATIEDYNINIEIILSYSIPTVDIFPDFGCIHMAVPLKYYNFDHMMEWISGDNSKYRGIEIGKYVELLEDEIAGENMYSSIINSCKIMKKTS